MVAALLALYGALWVGAFIALIVKKSLWSPPRFYTVCALKLWELALVGVFAASALWPHSQALASTPTCLWVRAQEALPPRETIRSILAQSCPQSQLRYASRGALSAFLPTTSHALDIEQALRERTSEPFEIPSLLLLEQHIRSAPASAPITRVVLLSDYSAYSGSTTFELIRADTSGEVFFSPASASFSLDRHASQIGLVLLSCLLFFRTLCLFL